MTFEGVPGLYFNHFLLWAAPHCNLRRRDRFASFSWAGWGGQIALPRENFVWYKRKTDGSFIKKQDTANIMRYFKNCRIVEWHTLQENDELEYLSHSSTKLPSSLLQVMQEYPKVFHVQAKDQSYKEHNDQNLDQNHTSPWGWDRISSTDDNNDITNEDEALPARRQGNISLRLLNISNGQAGLERTLPQIKNTTEQRLLQNWVASRGFRKVPMQCITKTFLTS
ncbi:hypothetical protein GQ44DRAFT_715271 [Phaeosphaeriaceae sp. PMI808]|nr:hypothetical protein GQ44DRAFT_715271 [Phaeosphaeriaceae sp. PMI808]